MKMHMQHKRGFTLLEIVVVVGVIGLITGAVVAGRTMLNNARLGNVMSEYAKYTGAFQQFKEKYNALPGDMPNATSYWGGGTVTCNWGASTGIATCNGDGNRQIADQTNYATYRYEAHRAWQQLAFSGLIDGGYTGQFESSGTVIVTPGTRVPKTALQKGTGWHVYYVGPKSGDTVFFDGNYGHIFYLGASVYQVAASTKATVTTQDMMSLDSKYDDGKPAYGKIRHGKYNSGTGYFASTGACMSSDTATSATYTLSTTQAYYCVPIFITGF
jgi:prepilin-type N-terminal cleavage/methylation domain-containing protein